MFKNQFLIVNAPFLMDNWLVVYLPTPLKNMSSSVGIIIHNIWKIKVMFQTTNQIIVLMVNIHMCHGSPQFSSDKLPFWWLKSMKFTLW